MPCFVCTKCLCIDNTATGHYWTIRKGQFSNIAPELDGRPLCCECAPGIFSDGTLTGYGRWHNMFPKETFITHLKKHPEDAGSLLNLPPNWKKLVYG